MQQPTKRGERSSGPRVRPEDTQPVKIVSRGQNTFRGHGAREVLPNDPPLASLQAAAAALIANQFFFVTPGSGLDPEDPGRTAMQVLVLHAHLAFEGERSEVWYAGLHQRKTRYACPEQPDSKSVLQALRYHLASNSEATFPPEAFACLLKLLYLKHHEINICDHRFVPYRSTNLAEPFDLGIKSDPVDLALYGVFARDLLANYGVLPQYAFPYYVAYSGMAGRGNSDLLRRTLLSYNPSLAQSQRVDVMVSWMERSQAKIASAAPEWRKRYIVELCVLFNHAEIALPLKEHALVAVLAVPDEVYRSRYLSRKSIPDVFSVHSDAATTAVASDGGSEETPAAAEGEEAPSQEQGEAAAAPEDGGEGGATAASEGEFETAAAPSESAPAPESGEAGASEPAEGETAAAPDSADSAAATEESGGEDEGGGGAGGGEEGDEGAAEADDSGTAPAVQPAGASLPGVQAIERRRGGRHRRRHHHHHGGGGLGRFQRDLVRHRYLVEFSREANLSLREDPDVVLAMRLALLYLLARSQQDRIVVAKSMFAQPNDLLRRAALAEHTPLLAPGGAPRDPRDWLSFLAIYDSLDFLQPVPALGAVDDFTERVNQALPPSDRAYAPSLRVKRYLTAYAGGADWKTLWEHLSGGKKLDARGQEAIEAYLRENPRVPPETLQTLLYLATTASSSSSPPSS